MIYFYSGTPGSGKSLHLADVIKHELWSGNNVIGNIPININIIRKAPFGKKRKTGLYYYVKNQYITKDFFINYARKFHQRGKESQTLIILDEAQILFSPSMVKLKSQFDRNFRVDWLDFFTQHRHFGFDIIMVSQFDKLIDPQIRVLFEYNVIHRKANNMAGFIPFFLKLFNVKLFCFVTYWYGSNTRLKSTFFTYKKEYSKIYDSFQRFSELEQENNKKVGLIEEKK